MPFERVWDSSCPLVYDKWEADGATWVIQDLLPEDDDEAVRLLVEHLVPDESLCMACDLMKDEVGYLSMAEYWKVAVKKRMSLGCYVHKGGEKTLAALNCCVVVTKGEEQDLHKIEGESWINVYKALEYVESKTSAYKYLGLDQLLYAMGLVVRRDFRGAKLGARILAARKPLALTQGIKGTSTVFTGIASQKSAERAGFTTIAEVTMTELADNGLNYPRDDRIIKCMVKSFV